MTPIKGKVIRQSTIQKHNGQRYLEVREDTCTIVYCLTRLLGTMSASRTKLVIGDQQCYRDMYSVCYVCKIIRTPNNELHVIKCNICLSTAFLPANMSSLLIGPLPINRASNISASMLRLSSQGAEAHLHRLFPQSVFHSHH